MTRILRLLLLTGLICTTVAAQNWKDTVTAFVASLPHPTSVEEFQTPFHFAPLNQDTTSVCWSFATTSFIESEMQRVGLKPVPLARMYPVYCIFLEKARRFVETKGASRFAPGDLFSGVLTIVRKYGLVPQEAYRGQTRACETFNHDSLYAELEGLMKSVKQQGLWDEAAVLGKTKVILDKHLGAPPASFEFDGSTYTPASFRDKVVRLPWDDYVTVTSFLYQPFGRYIELRVPDNWMHLTSYFNVPLDQFYASLKEAIRHGYTAAIDADISEPSYRETKEFGIIPPFDIALSGVSQESREFRFRNGSTTDDHLMHIIGFRTFGDQDWFLVKDSWQTAFDGPLHGYVFFHASYIKLKILAYLIHRDAVPAIREQILSRSHDQ